MAENAWEVTLLNLGAEEETAVLRLSDAGVSIAQHVIPLRSLRSWDHEAESNVITLRLLSGAVFERARGDAGRLEGGAAGEQGEQGEAAHRLCAAIAAFSDAARRCQMRCGASLPQRFCAVGASSGASLQH